MGDAGPTRCARCRRKATCLAYREPAWEFSCDDHTDVVVDTDGLLVSPAPDYWIPLDDSQGPRDNFLRHPRAWLRHLDGKQDVNMAAGLRRFTRTAAWREFSGRIRRRS